MTENPKPLTTHNPIEAVRALLDVFEAIGSTLDFPHIVERIILAARRLLVGKRAAVWVWDDEDECMRPVVPDSASTTRVRLPAELLAVFAALRLKASEVPLIAELQKGEQAVVIADAWSSALISPVLARQFGARSLLAVPFHFQDRFMGALYIDSGDQLYAFSRDEIELATALARQATLALERARLYQASLRAATEAETLRQAGAAVASHLDLQQVLNSILIQLEKVVPYDSACVFLCEQNAIRAVTAYGFPHPEQLINQIFPLEDPLMAAVFENGYLILSDAQADPRFGRWGETTYTRGWLGVAIASHQKFVGYFTLDSRRAGAFRPEHARLAQAFASQAAIAIENARLYQSAREAANRRAALHRASQELIAASLQPQQVYEAIHRAAEAVMPAEAFVIVILDAEANEFEAVYMVDNGGSYPPRRVPKNAGLVSRVVSNNQTLHIPKVEQFEATGAVHFGSPRHVRSVLAVPLREGGAPVGMISAQSYSPYAYTSEDQELLEMLAAHAGVALDNTRLFQEVQRLAITDPLTGPFNRRGLFEIGQREVERFRRFNRPLAAVMFDIDRFKQINDTFGHAIGDQVLCCLAQNTRDIIREVDTLGRYGGEEFVILLPETDLESAAQVAERLRAAIASTPMQTDQGPMSITISLGVVSLSPDIASLDQLIDRADAAMYAAKQNGRNQVQRAA